MLGLDAHCIVLYVHQPIDHCQSSHPQILSKQNLVSSAWVASDDVVHWATDMGTASAWLL